MALNFPDSPTLNQIYTDIISGFSYQWDGVVWQSYTSTSSSEIKIIDDISNSFNNSLQTFALTVTGSALFPANPQQLRVVLDGVIQEPGTDYIVLNSNIIFTTPPSSGLNCSIISLGPAVPIGTVGDGTITPLKLSTGGPSWNSSGDLVVSGNVNLGDNNKIILGNDNDLQIVHNGTDTFIDEFGSGQLYIRSNNLYFKNSGTNEDYAAFLNNGSVQLYYDNSLKFETIGAGITITGTIFTDQLSVSGVVTAADINSTSDVNLKTNIQTVENALDTISSLRGVSFDWKETGMSSYGVIAQELEEVLPELVKNGENKSVNYNGIIGVLIEAVKELSSEIEELKQQLNK